MKHISFVVKLIISVVLLVLVVRQGSWEVMYQALQGFTGTTLALVTLLEIAALGVAALRWKLLLPDQSLSTLFRYTLVGQLYALILPGQLAGDVMKTVRFSYGSDTSGARIASSVVIDKINGFLSVLLILGVGLVYGTVQQGWMYGAPALLLSILLVGVLGVGKYVVVHESFIRVLRYVAIRHPSLAVWCARGESILRAYTAQLRNGWALIGNVLLGCVFQILAIGITMVCASALGIHVGFFEWCWIFGVISLAVALPITVAGIGVREGLFVYYLVALGVSYNAALTLSLAILAVQGAAACVGGLCELWSIHSTDSVKTQ